MSQNAFWHVFDITQKGVFSQTIFANFQNFKYRIPITFCCLMRKVRLFFLSPAQAWPFFMKRQMYVPILTAAIIIPFGWFSFLSLKNLFSSWSIGHILKQTLLLWVELPVHSLLVDIFRISPQVLHKNPLLKWGIPSIVVCRSDHRHDSVKRRTSFPETIESYDLVTHL